MFGIYEGGNLIAKFTAPLSVRSNKPIITSDALSLKRYSSVSTAQRWEIETGVEPLSHTANELMVHLVTKGNTEIINIKMPQNYGVMRLHEAGGTPLATGALLANAVTINSHSGFIPKGSFIKFAGHSKIYMARSSLRNNGVLNIYPRLVGVVSNSQVSTGASVIANFYYDTDVMTGMTYTDGILMDIGTVRLVEHLDD